MEVRGGPLGDVNAERPTIDIRELGASPTASAAVNTTAIQDAWNRAKAFGVGRITMGPGAYQYTTLDFSDSRSIEMAGDGSAGSRSASGPVSELVCTASGAGNGITLGSSQGITFRNLRLRYSNPAFTGAVIKLGQSAALSDAGHIHFYQCRLEGTVGVATSAACLVDTSKSIIVGFHGVGFQSAVRAVKGRASGEYANVVTFDQNCSFNEFTAPPILNPGERWTIADSTFQQLADGKAGAVEFNLPDFMIGFKYSGNWHGDVTVPGGNWLNIKPFGGDISGGNYFGDALGTGYAIGLQGGTDSCHIAGNYVATAVGVNCLASSVLGLAVVGNKFFGATPIANVYNASLPHIKGNNGYFTEGVSADRGNTDVTLVLGVDRPTQRFATTLTANRTVTLPAIEIYHGAKYRIVRTDIGSFTLNVGGLKTIPSATAAAVEVEHDGTAWRLTGYQPL